IEIAEENFLKGCGSKFHDDAPIAVLHFSRPACGARRAARGACALSKRRATQVAPQKILLRSRRTGRAPQAERLKGAGARHGFGRRYLPARYTSPAAARALPFP